MKMAIYTPKQKFDVEAVQLNSHNIVMVYNWMIEVQANQSKCNIQELRYDNRHIHFKDINLKSYTATFDDFIVKTKHNVFTVQSKTNFNNTFERI